jgi:hypothetical protein
MKSLRLFDCGWRSTWILHLCEDLHKCRLTSLYNEIMPTLQLGDLRVAQTCVWLPSKESFPAASISLVLHMCPKTIDATCSSFPSVCALCMPWLCSSVVCSPNWGVCVTIMVVYVYPYQRTGGTWSLFCQKAKTRPGIVIFCGRESQ